jgi:hypothetical protein
MIHRQNQVKVQYSTIQEELSVVFRSDNNHREDLIAFREQNNVVCFVRIDKLSYRRKHISQTVFDSTVIL